MSGQRLARSAHLPDLRVYGGVKSRWAMVRGQYTNGKRMRFRVDLSRRLEQVMIKQ